MKKKTALFLGLAAFFLVTTLVVWSRKRSVDLPPSVALEVTKEKIAAAIEASFNLGKFPETIQLQTRPGDLTAHTRYTIDNDIQAQVEKLFQSYRPDYGAFVAMDATTGRVLSLVSYTREYTDLGNLTLKAAFPAASVFKIVTAAAALDSAKMKPNTVVGFNGSDHTLYRRNVLGNTWTRWTRWMTLREAFAKSVNTVFGKIGLFLLHPSQLQEYAGRFLFNRAIPGDVPVQTGRLALPDGDQWAIAEVASGYNRVALMSPVQGALMAAAVVNDGVMMEPHIVDQLKGNDGNSLYQSAPREAGVTMTPESAAELRTLMRETVLSGTSRRAFRDLVRGKRFADLEIGGKTGSLTGVYPKGKVDWFVGYAVSGGRRLAVAALTVNEEKWRVKSSYLARAVIERYFRPAIAQR